MSKCRIPLLPDCIYYMESQANGDEKLFRNEENYRFFLQRTQTHICPIADFLAYSLIPTQLHFVLQIKPEQVIRQYFEHTKPNKIFNESNCSNFIMQQFSNLLNSYAKSYNRMFDRYGSLFVDCLRRTEIPSLAVLHTTIENVHNKPLLHNCSVDISQWKWSSFWSPTKEQPELRATEMILGAFGNFELFYKFHLQSNYHRTERAFA